jgi:hypothetical protein
MQPTDMEHVAFAMLADPQGSTFGLWRLKES